MILPKSNVFVSLRNNGPNMDGRDKLWSMFMDGAGSRSARGEDDAATEGDYRGLKSP